VAADAVRKGGSVSVSATDRLLAEVACGSSAQVAAAYANFLHDDTVDWKQVNGAIIERWSWTRLRRIKEAAWKLHEETRDDDQVDAAGLDWGEAGVPLGDRTAGIRPGTIDEGGR
jgi:hypothetical protein